eukprot:3777185-Prymnesium_polylepis.1
MQLFGPDPTADKASAERSDGTTNHVVWLNPDSSVRFWPRPAQLAPFQPSPAPSLMWRVQFSPSVALELPTKGAPPSSTDPPEHAITQVTWSGWLPADTFTVACVASVHGMS